MSAYCKEHPTTLSFLRILIWSATICLSMLNSEIYIECTLLSDQVIIYQSPHSIRNDNCQEKIDFIFSLRGETIELRLTLSEDDKSRPMFYVNDVNEKREYRAEQFTSKENRTAVLKGVGGSFLVQCDERSSEGDTCVCKMSGTIFHKNIMYGILPNFISDKIHFIRDGNHQIYGYFHMVYDLSLSNFDGNFTYFNLSKFSAYIPTLNKTLPHRRKRALRQYIVEIGIVLDSSVYEFFVSKIPRRFQQNNIFITYYLTQYYFYLVDIIDHIYRSLSTIDYDVLVTCSGIHLWNIHKPSQWAKDGMEAEESLTLFTNWLIDRKGTNLKLYDHVMFFTRHAIVFPKKDETGFTWKQGICSNMSTSVLFEKLSMISGIIAAKVIAINIGLTEVSCAPRKIYIMSTMLKFDYLQSTQNNMFEFSYCSVMQMEILIDKKRYLMFCLSTEAASVDNNITLFRMRDMFKPGLQYSANQQCRNRFGYASSADGCDHENFLNRSTLCRRLLCSYNSTCVGIYPLEGTSCGSKMWCQKTKCVYSLRAPRLIKNCWLGDRVQGMLPGVYNISCRDIPDGNDHFCYDPNIRKMCCRTCYSVKSNHEDCEYGDRVTNCWSKKCPFYNHTYRRDHCCHTCGNLVLSTSSTLMWLNTRYRIFKLAVIAMSAIFTIKI